MWMFYSCTYGLEVKVTSLEIPSIDGQAVLWLWRMTLACCPECCCAGRNVMMGNLHILTFQAWLSAPSPLFAHTSCIPGPPNAYGQGWPAQRELPGAGEQHIPARPRCWVLPLTLWGSMGALGWETVLTPGPCFWSFKSCLFSIPWTFSSSSESPNSDVCFTIIWQLI